MSFGISVIMNIRPLLIPDWLQFGNIPSGQQFKLSKKKLFRNKSFIIFM